MSAVSDAGQENPFYYSVSSVKMVGGRGLYLYDEDGKEYLDCISGTFNSRASSAMNWLRKLWTAGEPKFCVSVTQSAWTPTLCSIGHPGSPN